MSEKLHLYAMAYQDRSDRIRWLLEELKVPYVDHFLEKSAGEMDTPEYRKLNPMGRTPTLVDGDLVLWESAAVCLYLADRYGAGTLAPKFDNVKNRAEYTKWMVWSVGTLECVIARMFTHVSTPEEKQATHAFNKQQAEIFKLVLNPILSKQDYILPSGFSAADIMLGAIIPGAEEFLVRGNPPLEAYMARLMKREAAIRAKVF
ncbi:MAG: glutathione S-transferase family protein [Chitinophagaceae bacterium]|nr:glutathione S-transferase family protein [Oligoflexus sp.]